MSKLLLATVTPETVQEVVQSMKDEGADSVWEWIHQMAKENPALERILHNTGLQCEGRKMDPYQSAIIGGAMVYQLLRAQATADSIK